MIEKEAEVKQQDGFKAKGGARGNVSSVDITISIVCLYVLCINEWADNRISQ